VDVSDKEGPYDEGDDETPLLEPPISYYLKFFFVSFCIQTLHVVSFSDLHVFRSVPLTFPAIVALL
jgi:hypothetical protein